MLLHGGHAVRWRPPGPRSESNSDHAFWLEHGILGVYQGRERGRPKAAAFGYFRHVPRKK